MALLRTVVRWTGLFAALAVAACSSNEPAAEPEPVDDLTFDPLEYSVLLAQVRCDPFTRCCPLFREDFSFEGCVAAESTLLLTYSTLGELEDSIDEGRVAYDELRLRACLDSAKAASCAFFIAGGMPDGCADFLTPLVPLGGECVMDWDCIDGYCPDSMCVARLALDEACDEDSNCESGHCESDDDVCRPEDERNLFENCVP
jgi:hypothetical protein